jgi:hypothetical protein
MTMVKAEPVLEAACYAPESGPRQASYDDGGSRGRFKDLSGLSLVGGGFCPASVLWLTS